MTRDYCGKCAGYVPTRDLAPVLVGKQTHSSPAEYEEWCARCRGWEDRDEVYERAAAKYDGEGRDWR